MSSKREKQKARQRQLDERRERRRAGHPSPTAPTKLSVTLGAEGLEALGPLIVAQWSVPVALEQQLLAEGAPIPPPISGHMLFDTGARRTAISLSAAQQLGLRPVHMAHTFGAHGEQLSEVYFARWILQITDDGRRVGDDLVHKVLEIANDIECIAVPSLQETFAALGTNRDGTPIRVIGIIGRDFMKISRFHYDGPQGVLRLEVDLAKMKRAEP